jgi:hypothetical protein
MIRERKKENVDKNKTEKKAVSKEKTFTPDLIEKLGLVQRKKSDKKSNVKSSDTEKAVAKSDSNKEKRKFKIDEFVNVFNDNEIVDV